MCEKAVINQWDILNIGQKGSDSGFTCVPKREYMVESEENSLPSQRGAEFFAQCMIFLIKQTN